MPSCGEIGATIEEVEATQRAAADAGANICTIGKTILARTHRGEDVAILEHERVRFERKVSAKLIEVRLITRPGSPPCYIPAEAIGARA